MTHAWFRAPMTRVRRRDPRKSRPLSWSVPIEALEARKLLTFTDVSQLAGTYLGHSGPTNLYINFDGGTVPYDPVTNPQGSTLTIRPFETEAGDITQNRNRDIQDILFQASEIYAPFNVEVHRISGAGAYSQGNGDSTIFVGANEANSTTTNTVPTGFSFTKYSYSVAYNPSVDSPTTTHTINSDPYDVAFVDTVIGSTTDPSRVYASQHTRRAATDGSRVDVAGIAEGIAHEAGHTFGLSHIRADGLTDPTPLRTGTTNDVMSYDSTNQYFSNKNLNLTSDNNSGTSTTFSNSYPNYLDFKTVVTRTEVIEYPYRVNLQTQNSFRTLQYLLGVRPTDKFSNVADTSAVDPTYFTQAGPGTAPQQLLSANSIVYSTLSRPGDDHVFTITPTFSGTYGTLNADKIIVTPSSTGLKPELLVYDATGKTLVSFAEPAPDGTTSIILAAGATYKVVVTSHDGNTIGNYSLSVTPTNSITAIKTVAAAARPQTPTPTPTTAVAFAGPGAGATGIGAAVWVPLDVTTPEASLFTLVTPTTSRPKVVIS